MQNANATLPLAGRNPVSIMNLPGISSPVATIGSTMPGAAPAHSSWSDVLKAVHGQHGGSHRGNGINNIQTSTDSGQDGFGASATSDDTSVDAFGTPSVKPSSTSNLIASISDPFTSIASNLAVQAQLGSPLQLLDF
jgi:hypothetical protein